MVLHTAHHRASLPRRASGQIIQAIHRSWKAKIIKSERLSASVYLLAPLPSPSSIKMLRANYDSRMSSPVIAVADVAFGETAEERQSLKNEPTGCYTC